jgi:hypothetical protein
MPRLDTCNSEGSRGEKWRKNFGAQGTRGVEAARGAVLFSRLGGRLSVLASRCHDPWQHTTLGGQEELP